MTLAGLLTGREWLVYVAFGALLAVPVALALGRGWTRQGVLAFAGVVLVCVLYVVALIAGCPEDARECAPELALVLGGFVLVGWLLGIAAVAAGRRLLAARRR
ncbi:MAG TPA: hypothetical protein VNJ53_05055 [Gaiellaceae bacterium]|nr:hypothetical protein [Gaiellaceae bacterium]